MALYSFPLMLIWVVYFLFLICLGVLSFKINKKVLREISFAVLLVFTGISVFIFIVSCFGIGWVGCG